MKTVIAVTAGDVSGIGPEVIVRSLAEISVDEECLPVLIGHPKIFDRAARLACVRLPLQELAADWLDRDSFREAVTAIGAVNRIPCINPADDSVLRAPDGRVSELAGDAAFRYLLCAIRLAQHDSVDAVATAPLNKAALYLAGHHYPGHTEILAEKCGVRQFAMMLHLPEASLAPWRQMIAFPATSSGSVSGHGISIAHVTLHTSVASIPGLLTTEGIADKIRLMSDFLAHIGCKRSAIAVCALNPHGGENGLFGKEEQELIRPAIEHCRETIRDVSGPHPVDTLIRRAVCGEFDGIVAMYHDQGHIPMKLIGFHSAVNITLGLPIIRTSPTHGTAFDRAWDSAQPADCRGMTEAIRLAVKLARRSSRNPSDIPKL